MITNKQLFIDKLTLAFDCEDEESSYINSKIHAKKHPFRSFGHNYQNRRYRSNLAIHPTLANQTSILLMSGPIDEGNPNVVIEFNPDKFIDVGCSYLWDVLRECLGALFDDFIRQAIVKRIDIAFDASPLTPDTILAHASGLHLGDLRTGPQGRVTTINLGYRGSSLYFCIYNRDEFTRRYLATDQNTTRFEARLKPDLSLQELTIINNPFKRLTVVHNLSSDALRDSPLNEKLFWRAASLGGLQSAMGLLGRHENKKRYKAIIEQAAKPSWYNSSTIWTSYRTALARIRLQDTGIILPLRQRTKQQVLLNMSLRSQRIDRGLF